MTELTFTTDARPAADPVVRIRRLPLGIPARTLDEWTFAKQCQTYRRRRLDPFTDRR